MEHGRGRGLIAVGMVASVGSVGMKQAGGALPGAAGSFLFC